MVQRVINVLLSAAALIGGLLAAQSGQQRSRLQAEYVRLAQITGDLPIEDPAKVYLKALPTTEPLHFAWRVYLPPNYRQTLWQKSEGSSSYWSSNTSEFIARVHFRTNEGGSLQAYTRFMGGSSLMHIGDRRLADLLRDRWDEIQVEQLGAEDVVALAADESAVLLKLTLPENIQAEARQQLPSAIQKRYVPV